MNDLQQFSGHRRPLGSGSKHRTEWASFDFGYRVHDVGEGASD